MDGNTSTHRHSFFNPVDYICLFQSQVFCQRPGIQRILQYFTIPNTALSQPENSDVVSWICQSPSSSLGVIALSVPNTTDFYFLHPLYFLLQILILLQLLILLLHDVPEACTATSITAVFWSFVYYNNIWLIDHYLLVHPDLEVPQDLSFLFSMIFCGISPLNMGGYSPFTMQIFLYATSATWLCSSMDVVPAYIIQCATMLDCLYVVLNLVQCGRVLLPWIWYLVPVLVLL